MTALFKKIPQRKVCERVFDQVRDLITSGRLLPGDKLPPERELANSMEVSRSSVREAIMKLECLGFVEQRQGDGTFVRSATAGPMTDMMQELIKEDDFIFDLMEIRAVLETWGAAAAAERAAEEDIAALQTCLEDMRRARCESPISYELNVRLHFLISTASRNRFLMHMMNCISDWIKQVTHKVYADLYDDREIYEALIGQHTAIVEAVARRNPEAAYQAMADHLRFAEDKARKAGLDRVCRDKGKRKM
jgi:GntR family transcriptional repressor for pyruvate dehydrogenase complex